MAHQSNQMNKDRKAQAVRTSDSAAQQSAKADEDADNAYLQAEKAVKSAEAAIDKDEEAYGLIGSTEETDRAALNDARTAIQIGEKARYEAESARLKAEQARREAETARGRAENARSLAEDIRNQSEAVRSRTESQRAHAVQALQISEEARDIAEQALKDSKLAQKKAERSEEKALLAVRNLELYSHKLEQSNEELEHFAAIVSHDLKAPLRKIDFFAKHLAKDSEGVLSPENLDGLKRMQRSITDMELLIDDLLAFSKAVQSKTISNQEPVKLLDVLAKVQANLGEQINQKKAEIEIAPLCTVTGNADQLYQLFYNILENALKYQPKDNIPKIRINSKTAENDCCEISIQDNGIGFEQDKTERIFNIFERLHHKSTYSGTGVGLAICKRIAEQHKGSIRAQSKPGKGSLFIVRLPYHSQYQQ